MRQEYADDINGSVQFDLNKLNFENGRLAGLGELQDLLEMVDSYRVRERGEVEQLIKEEKKGA